MRMHTTEIFSLAIQPDKTHASWSWSRLPSTKQKLCNAQMFDPKLRYFRKGPSLLIDNTGSGDTWATRAWRNQ